MVYCSTTFISFITLTKVNFFPSSNLFFEWKQTRLIMHHKKVVGTSYLFLSCLLLYIYYEKVCQNCDWNFNFKSFSLFDGNFERFLSTGSPINDNLPNLLISWHNFSFLTCSLVPLFLALSIYNEVIFVLRSSDFYFFLLKFLYCSASDSRVCFIIIDSRGG